MTLTQIGTKARRLLGNLTTADYSDASIMRSANDYLHQFVDRAIMASGEWRVNGEIATTNLVAAQSEYVLPAGLVTLERIEANLTGGTDTWEVLWSKDDRSIDGAISNSGSSTSIYLHDNSMFFVDPPTTSVTDGFKVWYSIEPTEFTANGDESTLTESLDSGLLYGVCLDYCLERKLNDQVKTYKTLLDEKLQECTDYYSNRNKASRPRITTRTENYY